MVYLFDNMFAEPTVKETEGFEVRGQEMRRLEDVVASSSAGLSFDLTEKYDI